MDELRSRIRKALSRSKDPDPGKIAERLQPTLTKEEAERLVFEGLEDLVFLEVQTQRNRRFHIEARQREAARGKRQHKLDEVKRQRDAFEEEQWEEERARIEAKMADPIYRAQMRVADELKSKATSIRLELLYATDDPVCVGGEWMRLGDCGEAHLLALADEYAERAVQQNVRGAYYRALAQMLRESGCATVRELLDGKAAAAA